MKFVSLYFVILSFVFIKGEDVRRFSFQADPIGHDEDASQLHRDLEDAEDEEDCDKTKNCVGTSACVDSIATIENGACIGDYVCKVAGAGNIYECSCHGTYACFKAGEYQTGTLTISKGSCNEYAACYYAGNNLEGTLSIGTQSCLGMFACFKAGMDGKEEMTIGNQSCRDGTHNCDSLGASGFAKIGDGSCRDSNNACVSAGENGSVQIDNHSCLGGDSACKKAGAGSHGDEDGKEGSVTIGDRSCREKDGESEGNSACENAGYGGSASIGSDSCLGDNACKDIIATVGNGSCQCAGCCSCLVLGEVVPHNSCNKLDNEQNGEQCCDIYGNVGRKKLSIRGEGGGDPHFLTFSGKSFDYHGECDLLLVSIPSFASGSGLCIHIRTTRMEGRLLSYSYISGVAIRIGEDIFEVQEDGTIILNGERYAPPHVGDNKSDYPSFPIMFENYPLMKNMIGKRKKISQYILDLTNTVIDSVGDIPKELKSTGYSKAITVHANPRTRMLYVKIDGDFPDSYGLLGASNAGDRLLGRDGATDLSHNLNEYGEEWQVQDTEPMLFSDRRAPQFPESCIYYSSEGGHVKITHNLRRRLLADAGNVIGLVTKEDANAACAEYVGIKKQNCISDVLVMQDIEVADDPSYDN